MQGNKNNPFYNQSGYADPTAYHAMKSVSREERELEKKAHNLMNVLKLIADWAGFEFIGRIQLKHKKTRKEFK
jgi:hypothetical protein